MLLPPLDVIESWPSPNYVDPVTRGCANLIANFVLLPLVCFIIALRVYTRVYISKSFGLDDWFMVATVFPAGAFATISLLAEFRFGWDRHMWDVNISTLPLGLRLTIGAEILFDAATTLTKLSMLTLTYRIIGSGSKVLQWVIIGVTSEVALQGILFSVIVIFQCRPISLYWTLSSTPQICISEPAFLLACGIINTITDFLVVVLPIPTVWGLMLPGRQQAILMVLFGFGFIICAAGAIRTVLTYRFDMSNDRTWMAQPVWLSSDMELYLGIICASIPTTKKFISRYAPRLLYKSRNANTPGSHHTTSNHLTTPTRDVELCAVYTNSDRAPCDRKEKASTSVRCISNPDSSTSGSIFNFMDQERPTTPKSSRSDNVNKAYAISRVESHDELLPSANQSRTSYVGGETA